MTPAQLAILKADILASPDTVLIPLTSAGNNTIKDLYNIVGAADLWSTSVDIDLINDAVDISVYTPAGSPDSTVAYTNRVLACQTKLMALQHYTLRAVAVNASKAIVRAGLRDSVIQIPGGAAGAMLNAAGASGVNVLTACTRKATRFEKLFAPVSQTTGGVIAFIPVLQGLVTVAEVEQARELI